MIKLTERATKALICAAKVLAETPVRHAQTLYHGMRDVLGPRANFDDSPFIDGDGELFTWPHVQEAIQEAELARQAVAAGPAIDTSPLIERIVAILNRGAFASNFITQSAYKQLRNAVLRQDEINALTNRLAARMECSCGWVFQPQKAELVTLTTDVTGAPVIRCPLCKAARFVRCDKSGCTTLSAVPATLSKRLASMSCEKNGGEAADGQEDAPVQAGRLGGAAVGIMEANEIGHFQRAVRQAERDRLRGLVNGPPPPPRVVRFHPDDAMAVNQAAFLNALNVPPPADNLWVEIGRIGDEDGE